MMQRMQRLVMQASTSGAHLGTVYTTCSPHHMNWAPGLPEPASCILRGRNSETVVNARQCALAPERQLDQDRAHPAHGNFTPKVTKAIVGTGEMKRGLCSA